MKCLVFLVALAIWYGISTYFLPITLDEAYYHVWGTRLAWGYLDHPPGIALISALGRFTPYFQTRAATIALGLGTILLLGRLYRLAGLTASRWWAAILLASLSLAGLLLGVLTTPDAPLAFFWSLALHEGLQALNRDPRRWLSTGLTVGVGLLSKYTMALIGPVFLVAVLLKNPKILRTPWPYLGGFVAAFVFLPHVLWNAENQWATFAFQVNHRLGETAPSANPGAHFWEFLGSQVLIWGFLMGPIVWSLLLGGRKREHRKEEALFWAGACVPLLIFGGLTFFCKVEGNWALMYIFSAAPLLANTLNFSLRAVLIAGGLNALGLALCIMHAVQPFLPIAAKNDRILKETHGFSLLAEKLGAVPDPLYADTYQLAAMLRYYLPTRDIKQWPGMNRPSEFTRNSALGATQLETLEEQATLSLVTRSTEPPELTGHSVHAVQVIRDCRDGNTGACEPVHTWYLLRYDK